MRLWVLWPAAGLLLAISIPDPSQASCKTDLPTAALRQLDAGVDSDPDRAIADARARLRPSASAADALWNGQLYAVIADAYDTLNDDLQARAAVEAGRANLADAPAAPETNGLLLRLQLVLADTAQGPQELEHSVQLLNDWEPRLGPQALSHGCLLLVRGRVESRLYKYEDAARDGLLAHRIAIDSGSGDARAETGYQLITTFRRAGLYAEALHMADEVIAYTRQQGQKAMLAMALFAKAQALGALRHYEQASPILDESRSLSVGLNDMVGVAFVDHERCRQLVEQQRYAAAQPACRAAIAAFRQVGRNDQVVGTAIPLARIDLARGRPRAAAERLESLLKSGGDDVPPTYLPSLYRTLADAFGRIHQPAQAFAALQTAVRLAEVADERQRSLAVAVLNAREQNEIHERERQALQSEVTAQRALAANRKLTQRLALGLSIAAILASALLLWLLVASRRHARALRRQETILRETSDNAPDALALLDAEGRVRFANRGLFGEPVAPALGQRLVESVPAHAQAAVAAAVAELIDSRRSTAVEVALATAHASRRFELRGVPILEDNRLLGATLRSTDVTELRDLERQVLDIASQERHRLSSDLHEGLGQELTGVALLLGVAAQSQGRAEIGAMLAQCIEHVGRAITVTRDLARGLSPVDIEHGSLSAALTRLAVDAERRLNVAVGCVSVPPEIQADETVADHVYRIAFEAVTNAVKHGRCSRVEIDLAESPDSLRLVVRDNGCGTQATPTSNEGIGLRMMGYRARQLGGRLQVDPAPAGGTWVTLTVPRPATTLH